MTRFQCARTQSTAIVLLLFFTSIVAVAQRSDVDPASAAQIQELSKYPLNDFGGVLSRMQKEVHFPEPRNDSHLLPLLPQSTVFYAAFPNYGSAAQQVLKIFREERQARPALRDWWQRDMAKSGPQLEMAIQALSNLSEYVGDEIVLGGSLNGSNPPKIALLAQVRKPGLKQALEFAIQLSAVTSKPAVRVLDKAGLAAATENTPREMQVLVRSDYVIAAFDLETLHTFNRQLDTGAGDFATTPFGQRLQRSYNGGATVLAGADLKRILQQVPIPPQQNQVLQQTGIGDMNYLIWQHKGVLGQPASEGELSFTRPRRGIASWLDVPRDLGSLDFVSPKAILVMSVALKNLGKIFDDVQGLASASNPNVLASLNQIQQGLGLKLKDDLLDQLGGEITTEVDDVSEGQPSWRAILQVNDAARLQKTLNRLLATAPITDQKSMEDGITYHSFVVPSPTKSMEVGYAFVNGYLVIGSSGDNIREAVRLHREGGSLGKSSKFLASLPPGHSRQASALYYQDPMKMIGLQLARLSPQLGQTLFHESVESSPVVTCAYADETTIHGVSTNQGMDAGVILVAAAVAIPNLLRAKSAADEASAVANLRSIITAQVAYSATYPARGYARDLASLGVDPLQSGTVSPKHAGFLDESLAKSTCTLGTWCEKSGYRFAFAPTCPKLLCSEFVAIATPVSASTGGRSFCATSDGVVRSKTHAPLIMPIGAKECRSWQPME